MDASRFIAARLRYKGVIAMLAIAISFFVIIIAVAVSSGFRKELRDGVAMISGDVSITAPNLNFVGESNPIEQYSHFEKEISSVDGVKEIIPAVYRAGIIKNGSGISGALFKGTPSGPDSLGVSIPSSLSSQLGLEIGDQMTAYFVGDRIKARKFKVESVYTDITGDTGIILVMAGLEDMQRLNAWSSDEVSAIEVMLKEPFTDNMGMSEKADEIGTRLLLSTPEELDVPVALPAQRKYPQIFAWLDLIDRNVLVILILMTIVAGFNMVSGLLILLFRNISTIGTLKALGMTDRSISMVFLRVSSTLVLKGMFCGNVLALLFCMIQNCTHLIKLNPENYFVSYVPVHVNPLLVVSADFGAYVFIMLFLIVPSLFVSRVDPAKTVRAK